METIENIDNLKKEFLEIRNTNRDQAIEICDKLIEAAGEDNDELLGYAYFHKGELYYIKNDVELMFENISKSVTFLNESGQWFLLARAYNLLAITSVNKGNAPIAVDYYLSALNCAREHDLETIKRSIYINLGYLYLQNGIYREAQQHFEDAYKIWSADPDRENQMGSLIMIYTNLASCFIMRGSVDLAAEYIDRLEVECKPHFVTMDYVYVGCMEARYYNLCGDFAKRDNIIKDIIGKLDEELPFLDIFDDLLSLCELAFKIKDYETFEKLSYKLETVVRHTHMINLEKRLITLQIRYFKSVNDKENYLKASARFFDLTAITEADNKKMIAHMIYVRTSLERANESKRKIEAVNAILTEKSETDHLTGLANRYRLTDYSQNLIDDCIANMRKLAVEILDIDYFKEYNDTYGHQAGDSCIKKVASLLDNLQNDHIFCARYGGDEFIVIYTDYDDEKVVSMAQELKKKVMDLNLTLESHEHASQVTISQGICMSVPVHENKIWDFLHVADEYLYNVKRHEKNHICAGNLKGKREFI